jgi:hypothetical protein
MAAASDEVGVEATPGGYTLRISRPRSGITATSEERQVNK